MKRLNFNLTALLFVLIVALSLVLRLVGINWDDYSRLHPDERFMTTIVSRIGDPGNLIDEARARCPNQQAAFEFFNTDCSMWNPDNINPGSYAYGTLPLFIVRAVGQVIIAINPGNLPEPRMWVSYDYVHLVGRFVNALFDTFSVMLIFFIGKRLFSSTHGLIAAALYALAPLPIQLSHYWTVDVISNFFFVLGIFALVEVAKRGGFWGYVLFGLALGAALASRINILPMAALLPVAIAARLQSQGQLFKFRTWLVSEGILILGTFALAALVFRVTQPYAFVGPTISNWTFDETWQQEIEYVGNLSRLESDGWPPSVQWFERASYVYPWWNMMMWGMGLIAGITATIALIASLLSQAFRLRFSIQLGILSMWVVGFFAVTGNFHQMTMRYYLPMYPTLFLLTAWFVMSIADMMRYSRRKWIVPGVVVGSTVIAGLSFALTLYTQPITRVQASAWMNSTLPSTVDLISDDGLRFPANVQRLSGDIPLQTAFNGETYLSDLIDIPNPREARLEIQFLDTVPTQVSIQLLSGGQNIITDFPRTTDENGRVVIEGESLPELPPGAYAWHIGAQWDESLLVSEGEDPPPISFRYFVPTLVIPNAESETRVPVLFRSPYERVPYTFLSESQAISLLSEQSLTVTELYFAHVLGEPGTLSLLLDGQTYTAEPAPIENQILWNNTLGERARFVLDRPMTIPARVQVTVTSDQGFYFTATQISIEGAWEDTVPTRFCTYQEGAGAVPVWRDCIDNNSFSRYWFAELPLNMAETDNEVKYRRMVDILTKADYLVLSSNRFYDAQPRVMRRFAMSSEYFNRLFDGALNYNLLNVFRRGSNFLGFEFPHEYLPTDSGPAWLNELESEEAFTVYDHPTVFVFQNAGFETRLFPAFAGEVVTAALAAASPIERLELDALPAPTYQLATEPLSNAAVTGALLIWTIGFFALGWLSFPFLYTIFPSLPLRGFGVARALSWLLLSLVPWWLTSVVGTFFWTQAGVWLVLIAFMALNAYIFIRRRAEITAYVKQHFRLMLVAEGLFLLVFLFGLLLRAVNPDLWQIARGGEKPMDFAYLNAVLRTSVFPPPNPWMAEFPINYYYFGFVIASFPIKIAGIASEIGYNLFMSTLYAVVASVVFTIGYVLLPAARTATKIGLAIVGTTFAMVAGNLGALKLLLNPEPGMHSHRFYWAPTRLLAESANRAGGAFNEVPLFSFLFGDLHAHIVGLLPTTLFLLGMWALHKQKRWWTAIIVGVIAGTIYMTNIWDVVIYGPLGVLLLWLATRHIGRFIWFGMLIGISAVVAMAPYALNLSIGSGAGITAWHGARSLIDPFLLVWGIPIGIAVIWLLTRARTIITLPSIGSTARTGVEVSIFLVVVVAMLALDPVVATSVLCAVIAVAALLLAWRDQLELRYIHLGVALIFIVLFGIEYIVIQPDVDRMNTVFKTTFQVWVWIGLLIPVILYWMFRNRWYSQAIAMIVLIALGLLFPIYSIPARWDENLAGGLTLDGDRFLENFVLPEGEVDEDVAIIYWLRANAQGYPIFSEWYEGEYRWNSRFSVQTGLPAVVGWGNHMRQQYGSEIGPIVDQRINDMRLLYTSDSISTTRRLIDEYDIDFIVVGLLERTYASPLSLQTFETLVEEGELERAFEVGDSVIYRVLYRGEPDSSSDSANVTGINDAS